MNLLFQGIEVNNTGVYLLKNGETAASAAFFQRAVVMLRDFSDTAAATSAEDIEWIDGSTNTSKENLSGVSSDHLSSAAFIFERLEDHRSQRHHNDYFLYSHPLVLTSDFKISRQESIDDAVLTTSSAVIFNMALSWHQQAMTTADATPRIKASQLYDLLLTILDRTNMGDEDLMDDSFIILKCLALNNRAHLYYEHGDYENSKVCSEAITNYLALTDSLLYFIDMEEVDEIRLNVMRIQSLSIAHAA